MNTLLVLVLLVGLAAYAAAAVLVGLRCSARHPSALRSRWPCVRLAGHWGRHRDARGREWHGW